MAKDPLQQLRVLQKVSQKGKPINDLFRLLHKKELWVKAYASYGKSQLKPIEDCLPVIEKLIQQLKNGSFRFKYSSTPQHSPPLEDMLVLAAINLILQALYQPLVSKRGQINNSPHQALLNVRESFAQLTWCIKGEISPSVLNHSAPMKLISRRITDRRFLHLIKTALTRGVLTKEHCFPLRSLLESIYLLAVDEAIRIQLLNFAAVEKCNACNVQTRHFERTHYIRSGFEFVIGICDTKKNALTILEKLQQFFVKRLHLDSNNGKLFLSHLEKPIPFLGYEFLKEGRNRSLANTFKERHPAHQPNAQKIRLQIPSQKIKEYARLKGYGRIENNVISHRRNLINKPERQILGIYNGELRCFAQYYRLAENSHHLGKLFYFAEGSFIKTIACKRKSTYAKTAKSMRTHKQGALAVAEKNPNGIIEICQFIKLSNFLREREGFLKAREYSEKYDKKEITKK